MLIGNTEVKLNTLEPQQDKNGRLFRPSSLSKGVYQWIYIFRYIDEPKYFAIEVTTKGQLIKYYNL